MSSKEFGEWKRKIRIDGPIASSQFYLGVGIICAAIYNTRPGVKKSQLVKPEDFLPKFYETVEERQKKTSGNLAAFFAVHGVKPPPNE